MAVSEDDPYVEELLGTRAGAQLPPPARVLRVEIALGALLIVAVAALAVLAPSVRHVSLLGAAGLIAAYALAQQVRFDVGAGYTVPTQLVLMPTLLLAPPPLVPLLIAAGLLAGRLPSYLRGDVHPSRVAFVLPDALRTHSRPPSSSALLAPAHPDLGDWPVLALALASQVVFDAAFGTLREWLEIGVPPELQLRLLRVDLRRRRRARPHRRARRRRRGAHAGGRRARAAPDGPASPSSRASAASASTTRSRSPTPIAAPRCS